MEGRVFEMFSKNQKTFKIPKTPKIVPKLFKSILNVFWGTFRKVFCPVFQGGSSLRNVFKKSKNLQKSKNAQIRSQKCQNVFWTCFGVIFSRNFFCPVFQGGSSLRNVFKKCSKFKKRPKSFPNCPNVFWTRFGVIFSKFFLHSNPWRVESLKCF